MTQEPEVPFWVSLAGSVMFLVAGVTDLVYDWADRGDPIFPYLAMACSGIAVYAGLKRKKGSQD